MNLQTGLSHEFYPADVLGRGITGKLRLDGTWNGGTDEQEDELDDVAKGVVNAPTDDEGPGEIFESNKGDVALETEDEKGVTT